jgi:ribonuclease BN (tRNA processing enzyme)
LGGSNNKCTRNDEATPLGGDLDRRDELVMAQRLESFTSVILDLSRVAHCQGQESFHAFTMVDRRKCKMDAMARKDQLEKDDNILHSSDGIQDNLHRIQEIASFYYASHNRGTSHFVGEVHDDNEIDLSDGDDESVDSDNDQDCHRDKRHKSLESKDLSLQQSLDRSVPYLLVLGTGCASPAPLRGSSGYAIFMPTIDEVGRPCSILSVVLECGEGYLTMLRRHDFTHGDWNTHLSHIGLIWISHAHLDHYGDLPNLIYEIAQVKGSTRMCTCYNNRQRGKTWIQTPAKNQCNTSIPMPACNRCHGTRPTVVIAPTKVLHYLETALDCKDGFVNGQKVYVGISHRDFDCSPFVQQVRDDIFGFQLPVQVDTHVPVSNNIQRQYRPFQYLKNIQVDHCPNSHGCVLGLNIPVASNNSTKLFTLCYSGDTRPSSNLVRGCQDFTMTVGEPISLLLHEATFDDDARGKEEATSKRHSTVQEALDITSRMKNVDSLLLTHFSQRYPKIPPGHDSKKSGGEPVLRISTNGIQSASAFDGMLIPLKDGLGQILPLITTMATSILSE